MSTINMKQLLHNIKEAYVTASGDTEVITYGNIADKVKNMGGGSSLDHTVTFKVDNEDYQIVSVKDGNSVTAPTNPTMTEGEFGSWQLNEVDVLFPYTPTSDVDLIASVQHNHIEIEVQKDTQLYSYSDGTITKSQDGKALLGYVTYDTDKKFVFLVSNVSLGATSMSGNEFYPNGYGNITYDGETWYYRHSKATAGVEMIHDCAFVGDYSQTQGAPDITKKILDYYYNK